MESGGWVERRLDVKEGKEDEAGSGMWKFVEGPACPRQQWSRNLVLLTPPSDPPGLPQSIRLPHWRDPAPGTAVRDVTGTRNLLPFSLFFITLHLVDFFPSWSDY